MWPIRTIILVCGSPTCGFARVALSEEELSWAAYMYVALKEMPPIYFRVIYKTYKEHNNIL